MRSILLLIVFTVAFTLTSRAAQGEEPGKVIAPLIDDDTVLVIHFNLAKLNPDDLLGHAETFGGFDQKLRTKLHKDLQKLHERFTKAGGREAFYLADLADLAAFGQETPTVVVPLEEGADAGKLADLLKEIGPVEIGGSSEKIGRFVVIGPKAKLERLKKIQAKPRPEISKALAAAGDGVLRLTFFPTSELRRAFDEMMPTLPPELGGGSTKPLTQGMRWLGAGLNAPIPGEYRLVLQGIDAEGAQALQRMAKAAIDAGLRSFMKHQACVFAEGIPLISPDELNKALASIQVLVKADQVVISVPLKKVEKLTIAIHDSNQGDRAHAGNVLNLKRIGLGFHLFHEKYGRFPGNIVDKNGKPLLSWRVAILPLVGHDDIFNSFHLDEPWDSEHNKKLIDQMPSIYRRPTFRADVGKTTYLMPVGTNTTLCPDALGILFSKDKTFVSRDAKNPGVRRQDITDGSSNTILAIDVADERAVIWTKPDDWVPDAADPRKGVVGSSPGGFLAVFADASTRLIPESVSIATLRAFLTRNGNEPPEK